jgi:hypothetical protein
LPTGPADHSEDFSRRYAEDLDIVAGQAMMDIDIPKDKMGAGDPDRPGSITASTPATSVGRSRRQVVE